MPDFFGVYVHWPFCKAKCPYCDFNSHVGDQIDHQQWAQAYAQEIAYIAEKTKDKIVTSIFFGGGTPSLMHPETVECVIAAIRQNWRMANDLEITLEANPTSIEAQKFEAFKDVGVNRTSIGVQALNDKDLQSLGREHSAKEAIEAVQLANKIFGRVSFDLIYARPNQTITQWREELQEALQYATGHLSLYQLTIEQGTPFYTQHQRGDFRIPEADQAGAFYEVTQEIMNEAGLPAYEISNHAVIGQESKHNMTYWQYGDYAGIGPGAHGRLIIESQRKATRTHRVPDIWLDKVDRQGHGFHPFENISQQEAATEFIMMGLRLTDGISIERFESVTGLQWDHFIDAVKIQKMIDEHYLSVEDNRVIATLEGRQRLNSLLSYLLA